ncbi:related to budding protein [Cephalotrichum gorgonifer]|uniref:Related to budding protein n=1 Tax=Cephalotrichum gorgonifer TaxID=2041049 RepID=A0AAE8MSU3_9PEZI|nr:related to budding protein [Cephalotrichum gorgonifer]
MSDSVNPLRISKSPTKMAPGLPRPLSELSPTEKRRNSPSWNQTSKTQKMSLNADSSPFQSSPADGASSPRVFWQSRNMSTENTSFGERLSSPSPLRRSSLERLQKASRVKNSNILALEQQREYDPTRIPHIERPLAKVQGNAFGGRGPAGLRSSEATDPSSPAAEKRGHQRSQSKTDIPLYSPTKSAQNDPFYTSNPPKTPTKELTSPIKSSLSTNRRRGSFDETRSSWMNEPRSEGRILHRHAKSVTFDAAPPQVNEYEMATPDLSSVGSNSREGSYESDEDDEYDPYYDHHDMGGQEDSFDASLEDTDKTPVVGPDDWRRESPSRGDDPFYDSSPAPDMMAGRATTGFPAHQRTDSTNSNGEHRPLPPLPGMGQASGSYSRDSPSSHRSLPSPPPAVSKSEPQNVGNGKMTLEERLKLMMLSDDNNAAAKTAAEQQRERRMRRGVHRERFGSPMSETDASQVATEADEEDDTIGDLSGLDYQLPPRISRESILRRVNGKTFERESDYHFSSPAPSSPERQTQPLDPDVPIPSTEEDSMLYDDDEGSVIVRRDIDDCADSYSFRDMSVNDEGSVVIHEDKDEDAPSIYSDPSASQELPPLPAPEKALSPEDLTPLASPTEKVSSPDTVTNPTVLNAPVLPRPDQMESPSMIDAHAYLQRPFTPEQKHLTKPDYDGSGWGEPDEYADEGTPDSVIHHPVSDYEDEETMDPEGRGVSEEPEQRAETEEPEEPQEPEEPRIPTPDIPERVATIKSASGSKLKTRPSATPSDIMAMREARRQVSREIPPLPERHNARLSREAEIEFASSTDDYLERHPSFKKRSLTLDLDMGLSLDKDFDRVIENQKRGYLMRQNTKLVAASDKDNDISWKTRSAGNSPVKADRPQSWTVEPWNGRQRQRSGAKRAPPSSGPVPPLPGQKSNAAPLNPLVEEDYRAEIASEDSGERGRLFVKVMGVKDLDLPISKTERTWFSLTLDNGVHCVTTAWLELARNAPIGQEFELVVPNDLEFQLTLNVKLEKPAPKPVAASPTKPAKTKQSTFSRVFASPKKRREMEMRQREEEQMLAQQKDLQARQRNAAPSAYELLCPLVAEDGSFGRSYVCLKEHESRCYGRPYVAEVACFNEWATEEAGFASSVKSKRGNTAVVRRAPYKIGKLELQLLFVPRPKSASDEDMPKSMNACIRELKAAEERASRNWEGHLSQQGGDCPYWRRRYFKLVGTKLTAYHEATRQPRATINLGNCKRLIDDRRSLTEKETTGKGGKRRRSAFAEEEEGYMFVEEGFRIRFNNGEVIDFYADTPEDKAGWMKVLGDIMGRGDGGAGGGAGLDDEGNNPRKSKWCEIVLKREESLRKRAEGRRVHSRTKSMYV